MDKVTLYYYEHCPYCVRVLTFLGLSGIKVRQVVLLNDDEATPLGLVGKKSLPILQKDGQAMAESLDIIDVLADAAGFSLQRDKNTEAAVDAFLQNNGLTIYKLAMPRWVNLPLKEFSTDSAKNYFIQKKTKSIGAFADALAATETLGAVINEALNEQADLFARLITHPNSLAAIVLFSGLHGLTAVKGLTLPPAAASFMQTMSQQSGVALLTDKAI